METDRVSEDEDVAEFFRSLPEARRREYQALAELDRRFGEDVAAEERARAAQGSS